MDWLHHHLVPLLNVIMIDLVLAGDNAIVVGMAASRVSQHMRARVIFWGIGAAVILRIMFASVTQQLLAVVGLTLAGGLLLLWVCWRMYRQITVDAEEELTAAHGGFGVAPVKPGTEIAFLPAVAQIALADLSMSLDNVLAVAGAARESTLVLVIGLGISIVLMAIASHFIAKLLVKYPLITWIGLAIIVWVAFDMIYRGSHEVACKAYDFGCSEDLWHALRHRLRI